MIPMTMLSPLTPVSVQNVSAPMTALLPSSNARTCPSSEIPFTYEKSRSCSSIHLFVLIATPLIAVVYSNAIWVFAAVEIDGYFLERPVSRLAMSARNRVCSALIRDSSAEIDVVPDLELEGAARLSASVLNWTMAATSSFTSNTRLARILSPFTTEITLMPEGSCRAWLSCENVTIKRKRQTPGMTLFRQFSFIPDPY